MTSGRVRARTAVSPAACWCLRDAMARPNHWLLVGFALLCAGGAAECKRNFRCPSGCSCTKETIICVGASQVPRTIPNDINSLWVTYASARRPHHGTWWGVMHSRRNLSPCQTKISAFVCARRSLVNGSISEIPEGMFALMPSLQLL